MEKTFKFKTTTSDGTRVNATINVRLKLIEKNLKRDIELNNISTYYTFSASGNIFVKNEYDGSGQCLDEILEYFPGNEQVKYIHSLWKQWHLNDLNAGTLLQQAALSSLKSTDYADRCEHLKERDLYNDRGYEYGTAWLVKEIPADVIQDIQELLK